MSRFAVGVVDQHVEAAEFGHGALHQPLGRRRHRHVGGQRHRVAARFATGLHHRLRRGMAVQVIDGHRRTARRERPRDGRADATRRTRHQHHLALKVQHGELSCSRSAAGPQVGSHNLGHVELPLNQPQLAVNIGRLLQ